MRFRVRHGGERIAAFYGGSIVSHVGSGYGREKRVKRKCGRFEAAGTAASCGVGVGEIQKKS